MRVLLVGSGGREHALARALAADPAVTALLAAPGNPGIASLGELRDVAVADPKAIAALARDVRADLVVIGPEAPLVAGAADAVRAKGIACFGPSAAAARLEGSKAFAKQVMAAAGVPTARAHVASTSAEYAAALDEFGPPYVVKHDGLAAGKGVVVTADRGAALAHARHCGNVVIEEYLDGPEVSLFAVTDGSAALPLLPAQDFKRVGEGGTGPNTGGMGAYAPLPWAPPGLVEEVMSSVVRPTLAEMSRRGTPFSGVLYAGLALTSRGLRVVEFNVRFGDPETQSVLALLSTPFAQLLQAAATSNLAAFPKLEWATGYAVTVVLAAEGYPGTPRTGDGITGADIADRDVAVSHTADRDATGSSLAGADALKILHSGTRREPEGRLVSAGGRVLCAVGTGTDLGAARADAYGVLARVTLPGSHYRRDIALAAADGRIQLPERWPEHRFVR